MREDERGKEKNESERKDQRAQGRPGREHDCQ
jgi:hypothetical protein